MELIERQALLDAYDAAHQGPPGGARKLIEQAPVVEAVPIELLCEWLNEHGCTILARDVKTAAHLWAQEQEAICNG